MNTRSLSLRRAGAVPREAQSYRNNPAAEKGRRQFGWIAFPWGKCMPLQDLGDLGKATDSVISPLSATAHGANKRPVTQGYISCQDPEPSRVAARANSECKQDCSVPTLSFLF